MLFAENIGNHDLGKFQKYGNSDEFSMDFWHYITLIVCR